MGLSKGLIIAALVYTLVVVVVGQVALIPLGLILLLIEIALLVA